MASALRAVEFYSGIGGMHYALKSCSIAVNVVAAIDINTTANEVYTHNFPETVLLNRNIEGIKLDEFMKFNADIFTMSPPCQPFTRQGNQKASDDPRTKSFLYIMKVIRSLPKPPSFILMENVKGFEVSKTREEFIKTLHETNYIYQEFLLSPSQFGVPNSRLRYFLIAVHKPLQLPFSENDSLMDSLPTSLDLNTNSEPCSSLTTDNPRLHCPVCNKHSLELLKSTEPLSTKTTNNYSEHHSLTGQDEKLRNRTEFKDITEGNTCSNLDDVGSKNDSQNTNKVCDKHTANISIPSSTEKERELKSTFPEVFHEDLDQNNMKDCDQTWSRIKNIQDFLEEDKENYEEFLVPENILKKKVILMDIVQAKCNHSCCFTKGYGHYVEGTGSVLQMSSLDSSSIFEKYSEANEDEKIKILTPLCLRYFTPREIANILCFPKHFDFPKSVTTKQKCRLLGNSLNVLVVKELMKILFSSTNK